MTSSYQMKKEWPTLFLLLVPIIALPFIWDKVPARVPIHWDLDGDPDRYANGTVGLLLLPCINIAVYLLFWLIPVIDPKRKVSFHKKPFPALRFFCALLISFFFFVTTSGTPPVGATRNTDEEYPVV